MHTACKDTQRMDDILWDKWKKVLHFQELTPPKIHTIATKAQSSTFLWNLGQHYSEQRAYDPAQVTVLDFVQLRWCILWCRRSITKPTSNVVLALQMKVFLCGSQTTANLFHVAWCCNYLDFWDIVHVDLICKLQGATTWQVELDNGAILQTQVSLSVFNAEVCSYALAISLWRTVICQAPLLFPNRKHMCVSLFSWQLDLNGCERGGGGHARSELFSIVSWWSLAPIEAKDFVVSHGRLNQPTVGLNQLHISAI